MEISFLKMSAAGNDFIVIDNRKGAVKNSAQIAKKICDRKFSVGADGVILLEAPAAKRVGSVRGSSRGGDIRMRIFNSDGSEADMCGNGVRCLAKFAVRQKIAKNRHRIETGAGIIEAEVKGGTVRVHLTDPKDFQASVRLDVNGKHEEVHFINTGVPHAVLFENSLKEISVQEHGRQIRAHRHFAPKGTNVNFVKIGSGNSIEVRTYERGVEDETLACGTGSTASALVSAKLKGLKSPVSVHTAGGETLKVYFKNGGGGWQDVHLEGLVRENFEGRVNI